MGLYTCTGSYDFVCMWICNTTDFSLSTPKSGHKSYSVPLSCLLVHGLGCVTDFQVL